MFRDSLYIVAKSATEAKQFAIAKGIRWNRCHAICEPTHLVCARGFSFVVLPGADPLTVELASFNGRLIENGSQLKAFVRTEGMHIHADR